MSKDNAWGEALRLGIVHDTQVGREIFNAAWEAIERERQRHEAIGWAGTKRVEPGLKLKL